MIGFISQLDALDANADQKIRQALNYDGFLNTQIFYHYDDENFPIRIIKNFEKKDIWSEKYDSSLFNFQLGMYGHLPSKVQKHLEANILSFYPEIESMDIQFKCNLDDQIIASISPIDVFTGIGSPAADEVVREVFNSSKFVNRVVIFRLDNQVYKVRLLHNPEHHIFTNPDPFEIKGKIIHYRWAKKYAIITEKKAPQNLINHIVNLINISTWDWYFHSQVSNGTVFEHIESPLFADYTYYYEIDTKYNLTKDLVLEE